jgi:hypothetical protein
MIISPRATIQPRQGRRMGEGRAVEGRQANPSVCLAIPVLTGSPRAFLAKDSVRAIAFLPGSAQNVECDVVHSKQTVATFLPGARTGHCRAQISIAKPLSNRELRLLESPLTHRKQTIAPRPNRDLSTNPCFRNSVLRSVCTSHSLALFTLTQEGPDWSVLTETGSHSEIAATHSKQTTATFLTGARIDTLAFQFSLTEAHSAAPTPPRFANLWSRRRACSLGKGDFGAVPVRMGRSCWIERTEKEARGCAGGKGIGS